MVSDVTIHYNVTVVTDVTWMLSFVTRVVFASLCSLFTEITFVGTFLPTLLLLQRLPVLRWVPMLPRIPLFV